MSNEHGSWIMRGLDGYEMRCKSNTLESRVRIESAVETEMVRGQEAVRVQAGNLLLMCFEKERTLWTRYWI